MISENSLKFPEILGSNFSKNRGPFKLQVAQRWTPATVLIHLPYLSGAEAMALYSRIFTSLLGAKEECELRDFLRLQLGSPLNAEEDYSIQFQESASGVLHLAHLLPAREPLTESEWLKILESSTGKSLYFEHESQAIQARIPHGASLEDYSAKGMLVREGNKFRNYKRELVSNLRIVEGRSALPTHKLKLTVAGAEAGAEVVLELGTKIS